MTVNHLWANLQYKTKKIKSWVEKQQIGESQEVPTSCPNRYSEVVVELNQRVPMRDGVGLFADIYKPKTQDPSKFPVVLIRMPYGKSETYCHMPAHGRYWAKKGYVCVIQDVRGKWKSEGKWDPFVNEAQDGYDTIDWVSHQSWCDGKIGMTGESYYGYTQLAAATTGHPNLTCIVPGDTAANIYGVWVYNSFALCSQTMGIWAPETNSRTYANYFKLDPWHLPLISADDDAGIPSWYYKEWIKRPQRDAYWEKINLDSLYGKIKIPVLSWGGWYDTFLKGTIDDWKGIKESAEVQAGPNYQHLMIAGTDHEVTSSMTGKIGKLEVGKSVWSYDKILKFFDHYLKGIDNGVDGRGKVEIFVMGDNAWRFENEWPLARTQFTKYFLRSSGNANGAGGDGLLNTESPSIEPQDTYSYDPRNPVQDALDDNLWRRAETLQDRSKVERRPDVLCYTGEILDREIEVTGPLHLNLFASTSAVDTDFTGTLVDVFPDGYCHLIQEGIVRGRFRKPTNGEELLEPGKIYEFEIDMWATSYVFKVGHRIRLEVSSSNFDKYDRNLNTGERFGHGTEMVIASQTIYHDSEHPSFLLLPVIPR